MRIVVAHLYPDYLNIYADRGNIAVLARRREWRGHELDVRAVAMGEPAARRRRPALRRRRPGSRAGARRAGHRARGGELREAVDGGAAVLAVCGGYQLLGRFYRDAHGAELPGRGSCRSHTVAGERRMIGDVLLDCELGRARTLAGFENHAGRTYPRRRRRAARPRRRRLRQRRRVRLRGLPRRPRRRHVPARAAAAAQPVARRLAARAGARPRDRRRAAPLEPLAGRARAGRARGVRRPRPRARRPLLRTSHPMTLRRLGAMGVARQGRRARR